MEKNNKKNRYTFRIVWKSTFNGSCRFCAWLLFPYYLAHFNGVFWVTLSLLKHDRLCHSVQRCADCHVALKRFVDRRKKNGKHRDTGKPSETSCLRQHQSSTTRDTTPETNGGEIFFICGDVTLQSRTPFASNIYLISVNNSPTERWRAKVAN